MRGRLWLVPGVVLGTWLVSAADAPREVAPAPRVARPDVSYQRDVAPILQAKCDRCHTAKKADGKLVTTSRAALLKGGASGPAIEPGRPDKSILVELVHYNEMPPKRAQPRVTAAELALMKAWIAAGAPGE